MKKIAIFVSGRGSNMVSIIKAQKNGLFSAKIDVVISDNKDAEALKKATRMGIETKYIYPGDKKGTISKSASNLILDTVLKRDISLIALAGFMRIIKRSFIKTFKRPILNIHPSLLPSFPGLDAQRQALDYGVKITGCTVHFVDEYMDHGPIILQASVPVFNNDTLESLKQRILKMEHKIYPEAIRLVLENKYRIEGRKVVVEDT